MRSLLVFALLLSACSSERFSPERFEASDEDEHLCAGWNAVEDYSAAPTLGVAPLRVRFAVTMTTHAPAACGAFQYAWDATNDGEIDVNTVKGEFEAFFTLPGTFETSVRVSTEYGFFFTNVVFKTYVLAPTTPVNSAPRAAEGTLRMSVVTREFPVETTEFTAASQITASSIMLNLNDFDVDCMAPSHGATNSNFHLYDNGIEVARTTGGIRAQIMWPLYFAPGTNVVDESTVNRWITPVDETFVLYPGVFTLYTIPGFRCDVPVITTPTTIVVRP